MPPSELDKRLEQLGRRLMDDAEAWERATRDRRREVVGTIAATITREITQAVERQRLSKEERRARHRADRARRRAEHRAREVDEASMGAGVAMLIAAVGMAVFALLRPDLWWLVFVAFGVGVGGGKQVSLAAERSRARALPPQAPQTADAPGEVHEVDRLCDELLASLQAAPEVIRGFLDSPEKTIAALRKTALALDARRRQLLAEEPRKHLTELEPRRAELESRLASTGDEVTRARLSEALRSLEGQRVALEQLATHADRVDGEYTSLLVSLQELRTRVTVARSAGSAVQLEGLKASVGRLSAELEAISEAMQSVDSAPLQPVAPISGEASPVAERERA